MIAYFIGALLLSAGATGVIIRVSSKGRAFMLDTSTGPQKFHSRPTPRVGGAAIWLAITATCAVGFAEGDFARSYFREVLIILGCSLVVVAAGLGEDVTKRVGVGMRLLAAMASGAIAFFAADAQLTRMDVLGLDHLLRWWPFALLMTAFCTAGIANAINIIDGYNGLAAGYSVLVLSALALVAGKVGDISICIGAAMLLASILGFGIWNFPFGKVFLGDAGAYFIGFMVAVWAVLLVQRHSTVSPWFALMLVAYPVWETLFSVYRKRFLRNMSPGQPDGLHLHMLVYRRLNRWAPPGAHDRTLMRNSLTAPYLWGFSAIPILIAVMFWDNSFVLAFAAFAFAALYNLTYRVIVHLKVPRFVVLRSRARHAPSAGGDVVATVPDDEMPLIQ